MDSSSGHEGVRRCYDRIADEFAQTRQSPWPEVETFLRGFERRNLGLDLGCGNGRHVPALLDRAAHVVGLDVSRALLSIADRSIKDPRVQWIQGDAAAIPLADDTVDVALFIATLHHLRSHGRRVAALDELDRVLGPDGRALISVWSVTHGRFDDDDLGDQLVPWTLASGERVDRYYHIFDQPAFDAVLAASALRPITAFASGGNHYAVVGPG